MSLPRSTARAVDASIRARPGRHELLGRLEEDGVDADPCHDLGDPGSHQAAAHDPDLPNVLRFHGLEPPVCGPSDGPRVVRKPTIVAMSGSGTTSSMQRSAAFGVATGGVLLGHWLTYTLAGVRGQGASEALAHTGHGYLTLANDLALTLTLAGVAVVFLGRLTRGDRDAPGWRVTALRLAVFQVSAFGAMETLERLTAGAPMHDLVGSDPVGRRGAGRPGGPPARS